jgi:hypothetical protein
MVLFSLASTGCDNGADGSLGSCASALVADFEGDRTGPATVIFSFEGDMLVFWAPDNEPNDRTFQGDATVDESGAIAPVSQGLRLTGTFDFDTCEISGDWTLFDNEQGTWTASLRSPASL